MLKDLQDRQAHGVQQDLLVRLEVQVPRDRLAVLVQQEPKDPRVLLDLRVQQVQLA